MSASIKSKIPDLTGEDPLKLSDTILKDIREKLFPEGAVRTCSWCGSNGLFLSSYVGTDVVFDIRADKHVHDKVSAQVSVECRACGHRHWFSLQQLGYTTRGGSN